MFVGFQVINVEGARFLGPESLFKWTIPDPSTTEPKFVHLSLAEELKNALYHAGALLETVSLVSDIVVTGMSRVAFLLVFSRLIRLLVSCSFSCGSLGGPSRLPGLAERLKQDLLTQFGQARSYLERRTKITIAEKDAAVVGVCDCACVRPTCLVQGMVYASLQSERQNWMSRMEYEEFGAEYVNIKHVYGRL